MSTIDHLSELESLRSQVADLAYELAARDQSMQVQHQSFEHVMQDLRAQSDLLKTIMEGTAADTGDEFFASLATHLTATLHMQYAVIGEIVDGTPVTVHTLAVASGEALLDNFKYDLTQAPCGTALTESFWCYEQGVQALFSHFPPLATLGVQSHSGVSIRNKQGDVVGLIVVMDTKPITNQERLQSLLHVFAPRVAAELQRKHTESSLQEQARRLAHVQAIAHLGSWDWEIGSGGMEWSDEQFRIFGYQPGSVATTHETFMAILLSDDHDRVLAAMNATLVDHAPFDLECRIVWPDGEVRVVHARGEVPRDETGHPIRMIGTVLDITERKRAEELIRQNRVLLQSFVENTPAAVAMLDRDLKYVAVSKRWYQDYRLGERDIIGLHHYDVFPEIRKMEQWQVIHRRCLAGEVMRSDEERFTREDGREDWLRWEVRPWIAESDTVGGIIMYTEVITERKRAAEALVHSECQLRTVLDTLPVGVWFTDLSGKPILANPAARQIWSGVKQVGIETAANGTGWWEAIGPSGELHRWALSHVLTKGVPSLNETLDLECIDGTKKTIRNTTVPVQDEAGVLLGAIVLNEDITVLRQAQEALKLTQFSVDHAVEGFFWIGFDARILNVNDAACRMLEYTRDELTTMMIHDINPSFPPETWLAHWEELKQKGSLTFESKHWSRTGRVLDTEVTVNYLQYEGREYSCAIMRDIGERKRAEEVLQNSEERFTKAFRVSSHLIGITEFDTGCCVDVNDACLEMFGYRREEVIGQSTITLGLWPRSEDRDRLLRTIKDDGMIRNLERSITTKNGEVRQVVISSDPVQINGIPCLLTVGHDVTERKRMEEALRQRERDLRAAIEERERISQDLHDGILQSLFAVGLSLETTKSRMSPKERKSSGPALMQAIDQLNRLMQEVRNFIAGLGSDLLQGKDLPTALHQMLESLTKHHPTRVRLKIEDRAARALSTEQSLHLLLVIQEAVTNCIRHGRAQEATVSLKLLKQVIRLSVRDNGCGFNPNAAKGIGHGLVNMAARARKIGGRLTLSSHVNEGTRVVLDLPKEASLVHR